MTEKKEYIVLVNINGLVRAYMDYHKYTLTQAIVVINKIYNKLYKKLFVDDIPYKIINDDYEYRIMYYKRKREYNITLCIQKINIFHDEKDVEELLTDDILFPKSDTYKFPF